jgi:hypothetical protein
MRELIGIFFFFLTILCVILGITWIVQGNNFFLYQFWGPKMEQARHDVYVNTLSYTKGQADRLSNLCGQIASGGDKVLLNQEIAHEFSDMDTSKAPDYLRNCLIAARGQ